MQHAPLPQPDFKNEVIWNPSLNGKFTISSAVMGAFVSFPTAEWSGMIWFKGNLSGSALAASGWPVIKA